MKIFITGLSGFIGKSLLKQFSFSDEIYALFRNDPGQLPGNIHKIIGDLHTPDDIFSQLIQIRPDICIHLAWGGIPDYGFENSIQNLKQGTKLLHYLVDICECSKIIVTGSCWEYGKNFGICREDESCQGGNYFVWAKRALCDFGLMLASLYPVTFIWTRLFYVYGPGQRFGSLIPTITDAILNGYQPNIQTPCNANDFIYVDDVVDALLQFAYHEVSSGIYNIGTGNSTPVWKACEMVEQLLGHEPRYSLFMKTMDCQITADFYADTTKTASSLNWYANTRFEEGIKHYIKSLE